MVVKELVALLGVKADKQSFTNANSQLSNLAGLAKTAVAAFAGLKVVGFIRGAYTEIATLGDKFDKAAKRTGLLTSELQGLEHAAELSGASFSDVEVGIKRLQAAQVEAKDGTATYADEFKRLGVDVKDSQGNLKSTTNLFIDVADGIKGLKTDAEKTAVAMRLFGRGGAQLIPMFNEGSAALREMMGEMSALGGVIEDDLIKASADYVDNQRRLEVSLRGIKMAIAKEMLPAINSLTSGFIEWWKANGAIIRQRVGVFFGKIARIVSTNVRFFGNLLRKVMGFVENLTPMQKKIAAVGVALKVVGAIIQSGPIGKLLVLAAIIGLLIDDWQTWKDGGDSAIGTVMDKIGELLGIDMSYDQWTSDMETFFSGLWNVADGTLGLLLGSFSNFADFIFDVWDNPKKAFDKFFTDQLVMAQKFLKEIQDGLKSLGLDVDLSLGSIAESFKNLWDGIVDSIPSFIRDMFGGKTLTKTSFRQIQAAPMVSSTVQGKPTFSGASFNPQTKVEMTVNAAPGMNEEKLGKTINRFVEQTIEKQNRAAIRALTPTRG